MKAVKFLLVTLAFLITAALRAADDTSAADRDWAEIARTAELEAPTSLTPAEQFLWRGERNHRLAELGQAFCERYPADPRTWQAKYWMVERPPFYFAPPESELPPRDLPMPQFLRLVKRDEARMKASRARVLALKSELRDSPAAPLEFKMRLARSEVESRLYDIETPEKRTAVVEAIAAYWRRFPQDEGVTALYTRLLSILRVAAPEGIDAYLAALAASEVPAARAVAAEEERVRGMLARPVEMAFTAVDGRTVDLAQLRGKVVLIDFWATWCGPCIAELPNVKRVHATYRDRGFEVVGISLDRQQDRQKLLDFVAQENMPWPQHFDGKAWKNEFAVRYAVHSIPAMLLVDQSGRVVSTNARGEALEAEVRRLLGL